MNRFANSSRLRLVATTTAVLTICSLGASWAWSAEAIGPSLLPGGAIGYLQVQVSELNDTSIAQFPGQLIGRVKNELSELSLKHIGLDVTQLTELTIIVPPFELLAQHNSEAPPVVIAASFATRFNPQDVVNSLPEGWTPTAIGKASVHTNEHGTTLYAATPRTLLFGSQSTISWWLENRNNQADSSLSELLRESIGNGQIFVGFDVTALPQDVVEQLPPNVQTFAKASAASATFDFSEEVAVSVDLGFEARATAQKALQEVKTLRQQGHALVSFQEAEFLRQLAADDVTVDESMEAIAGLAVVRQAAAYLDSVEVSEADGWLSLELKVEHDPSYLIVATLAAIGSAQNSASSFIPVTGQLDREIDVEEGAVYEETEGTDDETTEETEATNETESDAETVPATDE